MVGCLLSEFMVEVKFEQLSLFATRIFRRGILPARELKLQTRASVVLLRTLMQEYHLERKREDSSPPPH